ncbi:MAG: beta-lactamase family protein [Ruminococcaceae bacterium]|nr:beta-lactamase family protein [Oscillospiraceae bacterium]
MNFQRLTDFLNNIPKLGVPGTDCIIYHRQQEVYRHQSGYYDITEKIPMKPDVLYNLYSASKVVTCAAALTLVEKGEFLLTDPLWEYIPEFKTMYIKENGTVRRAEREILIRDLFTMTAGLNYDIRCASIMRIKKETDHRCPTLEVVRALAEEPLSFEPGERWQYSLCHDVLGGLIEVVSGMTLGAYCQKALFEPLGMHSTAYLPDGDMEKRLAPLYMYNQEKKQAERISPVNVYRFGSEYESGGAGLISSAEDYIKFAVAMAGGGKAASGESVISRHSIDLMRTNHLPKDVMHTFDWPQMKGYGYGLGVRTMVDKASGGSVGSVGEFGWGGAAGAYVLMDPEQELAVFYVQHMLDSMEPYIHPRLRNIIYTCLDA